MYRYLHVQVQPVMSGIATAILCGDHFRFTQPRMIPPRDPSLPFPLWAIGRAVWYPMPYSYWSSLILVVNADATS